MQDAKGENKSMRQKQLRGREAEVEKGFKREERRERRNRSSTEPTEDDIGGHGEREDMFDGADFWLFILRSPRTSRLNLVGKGC